MVGERIYIGLGGNQGDALGTLRRALQSMQAWPDTVVVAVSLPYRSKPVDADGGEFVNAVAELRSDKEPEALMAALLELERTLGRQRATTKVDGRARYDARPIDLDLLAYGTRSVDTPALRLPHPRMHGRAFVLVPLADIAPEHVLIDGRTVLQALASLPDRSDVQPLEIDA